jgi:hypothetical protein
MDRLHLHDDDMALLLGAIFHAPTSATFPPRPSSVASSMGNGSLFRIAAERVYPPENPEPRAPDVPFSLDLPMQVRDGQLFLDPLGVVRRFVSASSQGEQLAVVAALLGHGALRRQAELSKWITHSPGCPAATGMLCTCGLDEALS